MFQECFKGVSMKIEESFEGALRVFQRSFKDISKSSKGVSRLFQINFQAVSIFFQESFALKFCCCMAVIAATGAEGGLFSFI